MFNGVGFLQDLHRLISDDGFALSMLAVVGVAAILAFGFGATPEIVAPLLILGVVTALAERKLRAKKGR
jgi:hypothetical protein